MQPIAANWAKRCSIAVALLFASAAMGQPLPDPAAPDRKVADMLDKAHAVYGVPDRSIRCKPGVGDEIVVCADHGNDQRVPSTAESDPSSLAARRALDGNIPRAPDVGYIRCKRGADGVCRGNMGGTPTPVYYIDLDKLPPPPEGSDADKIAKGELAAP